MRRRPTPFHLVIVDEDKAEFAVEGPMTDDTLWNDAVCEAQQQGRAVRCFSTTSDRAHAVAYQEHRGLALVESGSIVQIRFL